METSEVLEHVVENKLNTSSLFSLNEKVALVTGASSGIGYRLSLALAEAGAKVIATARRIEKLNQLVSEISEKGGEAIAISIDVTDRNSVRSAFEEGQDKFGVADIILNNAGVADSQQFLKTSKESFDFTMRTNVDGAWNVAQEAAQRLVGKEKPGSIINMASVMGLGGKAQNATYCTSKGAIIQLTRALAMDLCRFGIRVNALAPGWFVTEMNEPFLMSEAGIAYMNKTPARRSGELEELIGPTLLLASDAGSFINGVILPVDGGHSASLI